MISETSAQPGFDLYTSGFRPRPALIELAQALTGRIASHHPQAIRLRLHLDRTEPGSSALLFLVCLLLEQRGPDLVVHAADREPEDALRAAIAKLERRLTTDLRNQRQVERHAGAFHPPADGSTPHVLFR